MYGRLLEVSSCVNVSDASLVRVAQHCRKMVTLTCCFCRGVTDVTLTALSQLSCSNLKELNIGYNDAVTLTATLELLTACRGMVALYCIDCANLTEEGIEQLRALFPSLRINPDLEMN